MAIVSPSADDVISIAKDLGIPVDGKDAEIFASFMCEMVPAYERLDAMTAPGPKPSGRQPFGAAPNPAENPFNAWAWKGVVAPTGSGLLSGRKIGIKDAICVAGMPTRNGSPILSDFVPDTDATVVTRILAAGGEIVGKTACENMSFSGHSHTSRPPVRNPRLPTHSAGGSSSGSAAAIAAGDISFALGCDQGGSVRIPASWSGVVGLKPTHAVVPYTGAFSMDATIDHCGPMGATVEDVARLLTVVSGLDEFDVRQNGLAIPQINYLEALRDIPKSPRIAVVQEGFARPESEDSTDRQVRDVLARFSAAGARVENVSMPAHLQFFDVWNAIVVGGTSELMFKANGIGSFGEGYASAVMLDAFAKWRDRPSEISPTAMPALFMGAFIHARYHGRYYAKAQSLLGVMRREIDAVLKEHDVIAMPTIPFRATPLPPPDATLRQTIELALPMIGNTAPYNASGHPAISVPCGMHGKLPIGLMFIGRRFDDVTVLRTAAAFEALGDWRTM